ncbi:MAG TPA: hypothetical protein VGK54_07935 [Chloroflexota bacterium]|jgi:hypothetical protein
MLGEKVLEETGKVTGQRTLPSEGGGPKVETSFQTTGKLCGVDETSIITYEAVMRLDGTLFGDGQGVIMGKGGEAATFRAQGVGVMKADGSISFRGAAYYQSAHPTWARLNSVAGVFEYEQDANGNTKGQVWEWK